MVDTSSAAAAGLTTFEWLSIIGFFVLGAASLVLLLYQALKDNIAGLRDDFNAHALKDDKHQQRQNIFMGQVCTKLRIPVPPEET